MFLARRLGPTVLRRAAEAQAAPAAVGAIPSKLSLTFCCPHKSIFDKEPVDMVTIPSQGGVFAVHKGAEVHDFFVSSGFAFVNPDSSTDVLAIEAVSLDELDGNVVRAELAAEQGKVNSAKSDLERAAAQIAVETFTA